MDLALYMGLKVELNYYTYWITSNFFEFPIISSIVAWQRFQDLDRCLHLTNAHGIVRGDLTYDKLGQSRWLVNAIREKYKNGSNLGKFLIIDEMMVCYKGNYSLVC